MNWGDAQRAGGPDRVRRAGLLAVLLALSVLTATATTTTTTTTSRSTAPAISVAATTVSLTENVATPQRVDRSGTDANAGPDGNDIQRDGSDTSVRVVRKVRGVLIPDGLIPPSLVPADVVPTKRLTVVHRPAPDAAVPAHVYPQRGPPAVGVHSSP